MEEFLEECESGNLKNVKSTLERLKNEGKYVNVRDADGIRWSAKEGHLSVVEFLVSEGADVNATDFFWEIIKIKFFFVILS